MFVIENSTRPATGLPGIHHQTLIDAADGVPGLALWRQTLAPGAVTPPHRHDCDEVVVVARGRGEVRYAGRAVTFGPDTTLVLPAREAHQIVNTGAEPIELIAAFAAGDPAAYDADGRRIPLPWER